MNVFYTTLNYISASISLLPLCLALVNYKYIKNYLKPLFILFIASVTIEVTVYLIAAKQHETTIIYYIYTLIEFTLISLFYSMFFRSYVNPRPIKIILFLFFAASFFLLYRYDFKNADHYSIAIESFIFICYCLILFHLVMKNLTFENLFQAPAFWINTGVLFYFAGNFTIFIFSSYIENHLTGWYSLLWKSIHTFFNVAMNVLFAIGFWKIRAK